MEVSGLGILGVFLLLAWIMPGFWYLSVVLLCFPDAFHAVAGRLKETRLSASSLVWGGAIIGGLLLTSLSFAIEIVLRTWPTFEYYFLDPQIERIAAIEAVGRGTLYLQMVSGSAFMHFNIGVGTLVLFGLYALSIYHARARRSERKECRWRLVVLPILVTANLIVAGHLFGRAARAVDHAVGAIEKHHPLTAPIEGSVRTP